MRPNFFINGFYQLFLSTFLSTVFYKLFLSTILLTIFINCCSKLFVYNFFYRLFLKTVLILKLGQNKDPGPGIDRILGPLAICRCSYQK